jgi:NAD(P)-dependent dehydrogenase (short-subunit alcohol dehydrogenase family)
MSAHELKEMEQFLIGKTVLVTGAGWGVGAATALLYAACGAKVIVSDTSQKEGRNILAKIKNQKGSAIYVRADVAGLILWLSSDETHRSSTVFNDTD